jgi:hypothetical protein
MKNKKIDELIKELEEMKKDLAYIVKQSELNDSWKDSDYYNKVTNIKNKYNLEP